MHSSSTTQRQIQTREKLAFRMGKIVQLKEAFVTDENGKKRTKHITVNLRKSPKPDVNLAGIIEARRRAQKHQTFRLGFSSAQVIHHTAHHRIVFESSGEARLGDQQSLPPRKQKQASQKLAMTPKKYIPVLIQVDHITPSRAHYSGKAIIPRPTETGNV